MSDVLRLIAGGLIALCLSYIGVLIKRRYAKRVEFFKSASDFVGVLTTELSMRKTPVPEIIQKFLQGRKGEFETALRAWQTSAKKGETRIDVFEKNAIPLLKTEEKKSCSIFSTECERPCLTSNLLMRRIMRSGSSKQKRNAKTRTKDLAERTSSCAYCLDLRCF